MPREGVTQQLLFPSWKGRYLPLALSHSNSAVLREGRSLFFSVYTPPYKTNRWWVATVSFSSSPQ